MSYPPRHISALVDSENLIFMSNYHQNSALLFVSCNTPGRPFWMISHREVVPTFFWKRNIGGSRGGRARRAPPHLPGILVFDDILGHIV